MPYNQMQGAKKALIAHPPIPHLTGAPRPHLECFSWSATSYMYRKLYSLAFAAICASTVLASAQVPSPQTEVPSTTSPVAYVYVSSSPSNGKYQINGYSAGPNGRLTAISGSPFSANGTYYVAVTSKWMFGVSGSNIIQFTRKCWQTTFAETRARPIRPIKALHSSGCGPDLCPV